MTDSAEQRGLALFCDIGTAITTSMVLEDVLTSVAQHVAEAFGVWECDFFEYDATRRQLKTAACWCLERTPEDDAWVGRWIGVTPDLGLDAVIFGGEIFEQCIDDPDISERDRALFGKWGEMSVISVPLVFEDDVMGCLSLIEKRHVRRFSAEERKQLHALAMPAAVAIHNARSYRLIESRARQLDALLDASRSIASTVVLEDVLALVATAVGEALGVPECAIFEYDRQSESLIWRSEYASPDEPVKDFPDDLGHVYELQDYPADLVILQRGEPVEQHLSDEDLDPTTRQSMIENGELSCLTVPILFEGQPLGLLEIIETRHERRFTGDEHALARGLAEQAAMAIHNAHLYRRLEEQNAQLGNLNRRLGAFIDLSEQMRGLVEEEEMLRHLGRVMAEVLEYRQWSAYMYDADDDAFDVVGSLGDDPDMEALQAGRRVPGAVIKGLVDSAAPLSRSYFVDSRTHEWTEEEHFWLPANDFDARAPEEWQWDDTLFVPLLSDRDELIGYIEAYDPVDRRRPTEGSVRLLEAFAAKAASDIEIRRLYERLAEQARSDGLTGLANHRHFMDRLDEEVAKAQRYGMPLSLLMLDLDDFKRFNDTYGHPEGDKMLRAVADILRHSTRDKVDLVARYGGEEFAVLLPNTPAAGASAFGERLMHDAGVHDRDAVSVAETMRRALEELRPQGLPKGDDVVVTLSVGVATYPLQANDALELVVFADRALYAAKNGGKNRVTVFDDEEPR